MTQVCIIRWIDKGSHFEDHKIIGVDIPMDIALQMVENGDAEIVEVEEE